MHGRDSVMIPDRRRGALLASGLLAALAIAVTLANGSPLGSGDDDYAWLITTYGITVYTVVGIVILWQRPGHGVGRVTLAIGLGFTLAVFAEAVVLSAGPLPPAIVHALSNLVELIPPIALWIGGVLLIAWFPDGHPVGRAGRLATVLVAMTGLIITVGAFGEPILAAAQIDVSEVLAPTVPIGTTMLVVAFVVAVLDLGVRYRRSDPLRRAQIRWVVAAASVAAALTSLIVLSGLGVIPFEIPGLWDLWTMSLLLPVLAIGIAVTRYHLYDIDRIVSRSIAYVAITVVLFAVFALVNLLVTQIVTRFLSDDARTVGVAISTLVVASLFQPLRTRVQLVVDRRFHRARYDAQRTVDGLASRLRGQLDLRGLERELQAAATDTVEPATTSVWLRWGAR